MHKIELKRLFKDNKKAFTTSTVVLLVLIFALSMFLKNYRMQNKIDEFKLTADIDERPTYSYFDIYMETEGGDVFQNVDLLKRYLLSDDQIDNMLGQLKPSQQDIVQEDMQKNIDYLKTQEDPSDVEKMHKADFLSLEMILLGSAHSIRVVSIYDNKELNLDIINYYYDMIMNDKVPFLNNKTVYLINDIATVDNTELVQDAKESIQVFTVKNIVISLIISLIFAFAISFIIIYLSKFGSKKLAYAFSYGYRDVDQFLLYDQKLNNKDKLQQFIQVPKEEKKVVLSEESLSPELRNLFEFKNVGFSEDKEIQLLNKTSAEAIDYEENFSDVFILVIAGETSRKWFNKQKNLLSTGDLIPAKIIQVNP